MDMVSPGSRECAPVSTTKLTSPVYPVIRKQTRACLSRHVLDRLKFCICTRIVLNPGDRTDWWPPFLLMTFQTGLAFSHSVCSVLGFHYLGKGRWLFSNQPNFASALTVLPDQSQAQLLIELDEWKYTGKIRDVPVEKSLLLLG